MDIKGLTRFNYWNYPAINPLLWPDVTEVTLETFAHEELSAYCQELHVAGNPDAIFEYMKGDVFAWRESWVTSQAERWRLEDTPESHAKLHRLMSAYTDTRGYASSKDVISIILRDQAIFKKAITLQQQHRKMPLRSSKGKDSVYALVADSYSLSGESVEEIYKVYKAKADEMLGAKPGRLLARHLLQTRHQVALQQAFTMLGHEQHVSPPEKPPLSSLEEVFHWLDTMAATLRRISGV